MQKISFPFFKVSLSMLKSIINRRVSTSSKFKYIEDVPLDVHRHYRRISTIAD